MGINQVKVKRAAEAATLASLSTQAARVVNPFTSRFNGQIYVVGQIIPVGGLVSAEFTELSASGDIYPLENFVGRMAVSSSGPFYIGPNGEFAQDNLNGETPYTMAIELIRFSGTGEATFTLNIEGFTWDSGTFIQDARSDLYIYCTNADEEESNTVTLNDDNPLAYLYLEFSPSWPGKDFTLNISASADNVVNSPLTTSVDVHVGSEFVVDTPFMHNVVLLAEGAEKYFSVQPSIIFSDHMRYSLAYIGVNTPVAFDVTSSFKVGVAGDTDKYCAATDIPAPDGVAFTEVTMTEKDYVYYNTTPSFRVYLVKGTDLAAGYAILRTKMIVWS